MKKHFFELQTVENGWLCKCDLDSFLLPFSLLDLLCPLLYLSLMAAVCYILEFSSFVVCKQGYRAFSLEIQFIWTEIDFERRTILCTVLCWSWQSVPHSILKILCNTPSVPKYWILEQQIFRVVWGGSLWGVLAIWQWISSPISLLWDLGTTNIQRSQVRSLRSGDVD